MLMIRDTSGETAWTIAGFDGWRSDDDDDDDMMKSITVIRRGWSVAASLIDIFCTWAILQHSLSWICSLQQANLRQGGRYNFSLLAKFISKCNSEGTVTAPMLAELYDHCVLSLCYRDRPKFGFDCCFGAETDLKCSFCTVSVPTPYFTFGFGRNYTAADRTGLNSSIEWILS